MTIQLYNNSSDPRNLNKVITLLHETQATPFGSMSICEPVLRLRQPNLTDVNYVYIVDWGRYYFVKEINLVSGDLYEIHCKVDVLTTYANAIMACQCICTSNEFAGKEIVYDDGSTVHTSRFFVNDPNQPIYPYVHQSFYEFDSNVFNSDTATSYSRNFVLNVAGGEGGPENG